MNTEAVLSDLRSRILAGYPLLFLKTWEEDRWERELSELVLELERGVVTWTITRGLLPPANGDLNQPPAAQTLLSQIVAFPEDHVFLVKDFHPYLSDPLIVRQFRDSLPELIAQRKTVIVFGSVTVVPVELIKDSVTLALPLPAYEDLRDDFDVFLAEWSGDNAGDGSAVGKKTAAESTGLVLSADDEDRLIKAVMGLTSQEAMKAWRRALCDRSTVSDDVFTTLIAEKRTLASGSDFLQFYDLDEGVGDIGGLDQLKEWLAQRALAYTPRAREQGVPLPKGMLLLGVQGCGKSLTARATARLLSFPLIRLDIGTLLTNQRGESERNLRSVLSLVESISPVVLWLDEMEKSFAGVEGDGGAGPDATMLRLVGTLLTWMAEIRKPIFVVATANSVECLPPEMLRRGRFDELFFVDLPNFEERMRILGIHLQKRGWNPARFDIDDLAQRSDGFSGAELEQIIVTALIDAFGKGHVLTSEDLQRAWRSTVPLSVTMEDKIFALRNWAQDRTRRATSDSRLTSMLEAEHRNDLLSVSVEDQATVPAWAQLATAGQLKGALVEYVRGHGDVLFAALQDSLAPYMDVTGDFGLAVRVNPNTVLWTGMSQLLCELIIELISAKRLYIHPVELERYKVVRKGPHLPILKEPTDAKLSRPSWLPTSLRCAPHPIHAAHLSRIGRMKLAES
jgi:ATP-dependent 26S proteasome regulatory subunit